MVDVSARLTREQRQLAELLLRQRGLDPSQLPMPRRADATTAPLSSTQHRLWVSGQSARGTSYGNVPMAVRIRGSLDVARIEQALSLIVGRHEVLRTTFVLDAGRPVQRVHPPESVRVVVDDLRAVPAADRDRRFAQRVDAESRRPFDPSTETLFRALAFRLDEAEWGLLLVSHHLATDGWGARLLLDELATAYRSLAAGAHPELPRLAVQYGDYAEWEGEQLERGALESQRSYWLTRLAGAPRQLALPAVQAGSGSVETESVKLAFPPELAAELRQFARTRGVTPYVVLLGALDVVLRQFTGQDDVVVGTILSRRTRSETEPLIGNFGNNLLLRTALDGDPTLGEIVDRAAATMRDALAHSDVPLELVAQVAPIPAFQMMFILRDGGLEERLTLPDATVEPVRAISGAATLDLIVDITDGARGIGGYVEYQTARFAPDTMQQFARALEGATTRLVREPTARLSVLPMVRVQSAPRPERTRDAGEEPATPTERVLARLWSRMLDGERVYRGDNFFRLGGDSLGGVFVLEQVEKELGHRFHPQELSSATLAELAAACDRGTTTVPPGDRPGAAVQRVDPLRYADAIKSLFAREEMPHLRDFFDRTYADAVTEGASSWVMFGDDDQVVGHVAMFPQRFVREDTEYTGALGVNLVVDRRHRDLATALALAGRMVRDLENQPDVDFLYGDPNDEGRAIMSTLGEFSDLDVVSRFVLPIDEPGVLGPVVSLYVALTLGRNGTGDRGFRMETIPAAAFDTAAIERPPGRSAMLRPIRTPALYPRRLTGYPSDQDSWYSFTADGEQVAAVLMRTFPASGRAQLCSLWRRPGIAMADLLKPIVSALRDRGVTRLQASVLRSSPLGKELRTAGFRERHDGVQFSAIPCSPRGRTLLESGSEWEITDIDCDRGLDL